MIFSACSSQNVFLADQFLANVAVGLASNEDDYGLEAIALEHAHLEELLVRFAGEKDLHIFLEDEVVGRYRQILA